MNKLRKLAKNPIIGPLVKKVIQLKANHEAKKIATHFSEFLSPRLAYTPQLKDQAYGIRHNVYCEELKFEEERSDKKEMDEFDGHSHHCVIEHKPSSNYAGTVRIVYSESAQQQLPLEKFCLNSISHETLNPKNFNRNEICEISRLAVPNQFRRRNADKFEGAATGVINEQTYSEKELRCFPFIAVGLYLSAASVIMHEGIKHCFVMMEPRLARSLRFVGIQFQQIGPVVDYHGKRAPYYICPEMLLNSLTPGFKSLFNNIESEMDHQFAARSASKKTNTGNKNLNSFSDNKQKIWLPS